MVGRGVPSPFDEPYLSLTDTYVMNVVSNPWDFSSHGTQNIDFRLCHVTRRYNFPHHNVSRDLVSTSTKLSGRDRVLRCEGLVRRYNRNFWRSLFHPSWLNHVQILLLIGRHKNSKTVTYKIQRKYLLTVKLKFLLRK